MNRRLLIPVAMLCSAAGFVAWQLQAKRGKIPPEDAADVGASYGLLAADMEPHWQRWEAARGLGDWFHAGKNITTEWVRAHAESGSKLLCFLIALAFAAGAFLAALPAFVAGLAL